MQSASLGLSKPTERLTRNEAGVKEVTRSPYVFPTKQGATLLSKAGRKAKGFSTCF